MVDLTPRSVQRTANPLADAATIVPARGWKRWLPGLMVLRHYQISWLRHDLAAGLVLTTILVPVGIAYAVASGLPAIAGLYESPRFSWRLVG